MRNKSIFCIIFLVFMLNCSLKKQVKRNEYILDTYHGQKILIGKVTPEDIWREIPDWKAEYEIYQPDFQIVNELNTIERDFRIVCVLGVWCPDSKMGVPSFIKACDQSGNPHLKMELYAVDRQKKDPDGMSEKLNIDRVPTYIIFLDNKEMGRMIEIPETTFEQDFLQIVQNMNLKNK